MEEVFKVLKHLEINYERRDHPPVFTVAEADKYDRGEGAQSKNLFLRNKKGDKHFLVVLEGGKQIDLRQLQQQLQQNKLSFASPERMMQYLGLTPGAVSPFGLINDSDKSVTVVVDEDLLKAPKQGFHPNVNTATVIIGTDDFKKFLSWSGQKILLLAL